MRHIHIDKKIIIEVIIFFFLSLPFLARPEEPEWQMKKSDHFIVYFQEAPAGYIEGLILEAESYYKDITEELGFTRFDDFWTWEKRAKIYLFRNKEDYLNTNRHPDWSSADVNVAQRKIETYINMDNFFEVILPHELGHIIFREGIGDKRKLPLWLDEGIACFMEKRESQRQARLSLAAEYVDTASFLPLEQLGLIGKNNMVFPDLFYAESASIIQFLVKNYGKEAFGDFCRRLREPSPEGSWEKEILGVYNAKNISEIGNNWKIFLRSSGGGKNP